MERIQYRKRWEDEGIEKNGKRKKEWFENVARINRQTDPRKHWTQREIDEIRTRNEEIHKASGWSWNQDQRPCWWSYRIGWKTDRFIIKSRFMIYIIENNWLINNIHNIY